MINSSAAIRTRKLSKCFGGRMVLREIDLAISVNQCVALTGSNGAGKTTLLRCLAAISRPTSGMVSWFDQPAAMSPRDRRLVGLVTHEGRLYAHLTLRENLLFAARMCAVATPGDCADMLLEQMGLQALADRQVRQISRGMKQRLALARVLIHDPPILLLDEPFSGLDSMGRDWLAGLLQEQRSRGRTICLVTHDQALSRQLADRTLILSDGRLMNGTDMKDCPTESDTWRNAA